MSIERAHVRIEMGGAHAELQGALDLGANLDLHLLRAGMAHHLLDRTPEKPLLIDKPLTLSGGATGRQR
jgi:hypothetical protein